MSDIRPRLGRLERIFGNPETHCPRCGTNSATVFYAASDRHKLKPICFNCNAPMPWPDRPVKTYIGMPIGQMEGAP
jgi:hypothetical protein